MINGDNLPSKCQLNNPKKKYKRKINPSSINFEHLIQLTLTKENKKNSNKNGKIFVK